MKVFLNQIFLKKLLEKLKGLPAITDNFLDKIHIFFLLKYSILILQLSGAFLNEYSNNRIHLE